MAILDSLTIGDIRIVVVDDDPTISGMDLPIGSIAININGNGFYYKNTLDNTGWDKTAQITDIISSTATDHLSLTNLTNGNAGHTQFMMLNGSTPMQADLNLNNYNIDNVNLINNVSIGTHSSRHLPNGLDPLATAAPTTDLGIGTTNSVGIQNSFSRSDHSHKLDVANTSTSGILTSTDWNTFNNKQDTIVPHALTNSNDTNIVLNITGTPSTALLQPVNIEATWNGILSPQRGGSGVINSGAFSWGSNSILFNTTGTTNLTLPTSGTLSTVDTITDLTDVNILTPSNGQILAYESTSEKWKNVSIAGDITLSATGLSTLNTVNSNIGTYNNVTVNDKGLVTSATNIDYLTTNQTITLTGDITGSGTTSITASIGAGKINNAMIADNTIDLSTKVTNVLSIQNGGTGATTSQDALTALLPTQTGFSGYSLVTNGVTASWSLSGSGLSDSGTNGVLIRTALNTTTSVTLTGTTNRINITNGDGTTGNPTFDIGSDVVTLTASQTLTNKSISGLDNTLTNIASGSNNYIQYKTGVVFDSSANFTYNPSTEQLSILGTNPTILLNGITSEPSTPISNNIILYSKSIGGRMMPKWLAPSGVDTPFQSNIFFNNISLFSPSSGTTISLIGNGGTAVGTISNPTPSSTSLKTQTRRFVITSANGGGSFASLRVGVLECWRGNATGLGGFFVVSRFSIDTTPNGMRMFVGLTDTATTAPTNIDPTVSTTPGKIGMAINSNTGTWKFVHNITGTTPTVIDLGANFPINTTDFLEMVIFAAPNASTVSYRVTNQTTGLSTTGTIVTNLPASTTFLGRTIWATNNATGTAVSWSCSRFGLESDY